MRRGAASGHSRGLIKAIIGQFGKVVLPDGRMLFSLDSERAGRVVWKIVRGLHALMSDRQLPETLLRSVEFVLESEAPMRLPDHPWFSVVRDTESLWHHRAVFDLKWLCIKDKEQRGHAVAMLFWDSLIVLTLFHDPTCQCELCGAEAVT